MKESLQVGRFNTIKIARITPAGAYLVSAGEEILLPQQYLSLGWRAGDTVNAFIYRDSEDRLAATTVVPKAQVGEFVVLEVTDNGRVGAFLDWGLDKDLLVPFAEQAVPMRKGERYLVRVYLDNSGRIAASSRINKFLETEQISLQVGEEVDLIIHEFTPLGAKVIIDGRYAGLLFKDELRGNLEPGSRLKGFVKKIREDKKIDVTLKRGGGHGIKESRNQILMLLAETGGFLPLGDKSSPEQIGTVLNMSKKTFKKAIGSLYKDGFIQLTEAGIKLRNK